MESKSLIWLGLFVGSSIGSFLPLLWGSDLLSFSSIILSGIGGILGIYLGFKISHGGF